MNNSKYKEYYRLVANVVNLADPIGLIVGGAPEDEYSSEINKILAAIRNENDKKIISQKIYKIFCDSFDEKIAGKMSTYEDIAVKIIELKLSGKLH